MHFECSGLRNPDGPTYFFFFFFILSFFFFKMLTLFFSLKKKPSSSPPKQQQPAPRRPLPSSSPALAPFSLPGADGRQVLEVPPHREGALERHAAAAPNCWSDGRRRRRRRSSSRGAAAAGCCCRPPAPSLPAARARKGPQVQEALPHQRSPVARGEGRGEAAPAVVVGNGSGR